MKEIQNILFKTSTWKIKREKGQHRGSGGCWNHAVNEFLRAS
jgi:hypothetical protein